MKKQQEPITEEAITQAKKLIAKVNGAKGGTKSWEGVTPEQKKARLNLLHAGRMKKLVSND